MFVAPASKGVGASFFNSIICVLSGQSRGETGGRLRMV